MTDNNHRTALVTGANKGIGLQIVRQLTEAGVSVRLGARDAARGQAAVGMLAAEGLKVGFIQLDICDAQSIAAAAARIAAEQDSLDILVNNAGIVVAGDTAPSTVALDVVRRSLETNFIGALAVSQAMLPLLRRSAAGRIVNISSSLGSLALNGDPSYSGYEVRLAGYNASKAALNMLTVQLRAELRDTAITVVSVCPGLTKTDLNGHMGDRLPEQGAAAPVRLALRPQDDSIGIFQDENGVLPW